MVVVFVNGLVLLMEAMPVSFVSIPSSPNGLAIPPEPTTVTLKRQVSVFADGSLATNTTVVTPTGNVALLEGPAILNTMALQLSVATGLL